MNSAKCVGCETTKPDVAVIGRRHFGTLSGIGTSVGETGTDRTFGDPCRGVSVWSRP